MILRKVLLVHFFFYRFEELIYSEALLEVTKSIVTYSGGQSAVRRSTQEESFEAVLSFLRYVLLR